MRLLLTADTVGGVWTYTRELVLGLLEADSEISILLVTLGATPTAEQTTWLRQTAGRFPKRFTFEATDLPLEWQRENARAYSDAAPMLERMARVFRVDLLHSSQFCFGALPLSCPRVVVAHSDVLSWHRAVRGGRPEPSPWLNAYEQLVRAGLQGASVVVAPTNAMLHDLGEGFGEMPQTRVVPNGRSVEPPRAGKKLQAAVAGRVWDAAKGMALLEQMMCPMPVLIAGETHSPDATYDADRLRRRVLLGRCSERQLLELFAESSIYVVTSIYEPFGLAAVEAAQCGCAIVARDIPSQREVWGPDALYFSDADELCAQLESLARNRQQLDRAQRAACERALHLYSRASLATRMLELYRSLAKGAVRG